MKLELFADYILKNGKIITVNRQDEVCQAIAIKENKIVYAGDDRGAEDYMGQNTKIIDLKGRSVTPGFIDAHIHFTGLCMIAGGLIVSIKDADSIDAIKKIIGAEVKKAAPGDWIVVLGYDQSKLKEQRHPTYQDLDEVSPENPVKCDRVCGHMGVYNSKAMEVAGISDETVFERPDEVGRDENGKITGLFKEASHNLFLKYISTPTHRYEQALQAGGALLPRYGITGIHEVGSGMDNMGRNMMQTAIAERKLKVRAYMVYCGLDSREAGISVIHNLAECGPHTGIGDQWFKMGPVKLLLDGSTSGPSSFTKEPYCHDSNLKGIQNFPDQQELNQILLQAYQNGFLLTSHAVGDAAVEQIVTAYEYVSEKVPREDARFRVEHCGLTTPDLIERLKKLNAVVISNPVFLTINGGDYNRYYGERTERMFAHRTYKENGIIEGFGSDFPVAGINPLHAIYGAVTRKDMKKDQVCGPSQKLSVLEAIRCHTYNNAYASCEEKIKGSLEVGKLADLAVLSEDILSCDLERIKDIAVDMTFLDGEMIYER